ncbi:chloride channel [Abortiporus biennis]|nr:chloride channel [Abortiporus biennis]
MPPLPRTWSITSLAQDDEEAPPSGPLSGPSNTTWRRQRLLQIGAERSGDEETRALQPDLERHPSYGTLRGSTTRTNSKSKLNIRRGILSLPGINIPKDTISAPQSPSTSPLSFRHRSLFRSQRPISAYDKPVNVGKRVKLAEEPEADVKTNGIRVWYSSFTSVDWLHDAIKDSSRHGRLRRRRSTRGKIRRQLDRTTGWLIVTIVGVLTALVAFSVVRSEQWLFDLKEGYCSTAWYQSRRFCCHVIDESIPIIPGPVSPFSLTSTEKACAAWKTWGEVLAPIADANTWIEREFTAYIAYAVLAITMAVISSLLTIHLTASTSFSTRKDSGVLSGTFEESENKIDDVQPVEKRKVMYYAAGSGIPEIKTILSGFVIHGYLGGRTLFTKAVGLALSVASGLSLGKEGPFVHIASCVGNIVSRFFSKYENNEGKRREILSAASAAGVAVAFGAPIGGVLFSLEEVSYFFPAKVMWRSFFCAMVAAMTLRFLDPFGSGKLVLFQVTYDKDWHAFELVFFLFLGVIGGVWGAYFSKLNVLWTKHVRNGTWLKSHPVIEVVLVTLLTTLLCFLNPYTRMGGAELVYNLFAECKPGSPNAHAGLCVVNPVTQAVPVMRAIFVAMLVKGVLTIITFGIKLPAGIFIPSLGFGACAGRIVGILVMWWQHSYPDSPVFRGCGGTSQCVIPGLYAMVGAAASLSGVTRGTVSLAVIMFELTDTLTYAVPIMLSILVAKTVADALEPKGIYDLVIGLSQLPYLDAKHEHIWGHLHISDAMDREVDVIHVENNNTVKSLRDQLLNLINSGRDDSGFPILRSDDIGSKMVGYIGANELEHALSIVADEADELVKFHATSGHGFMASSVSSLVEEGTVDPFDFSVYMDQAPLTVLSNSPLELVQQFFTKLGARYVVVIDSDGYYEGIIDKKIWLAFLGSLEGKSL